MTTAPRPDQPFLLRHSAWLVCAVAGWVVFQAFGNATRGYINTPSAFVWWARQWFEDAAETQHGLLVLLVSAALAWRNVGALARPLIGEPRLGAALMVGALGLHVIGYGAQQTRLSVVALLAFVAGLAVFAGGRRLAGAVVFPLGYLGFALPLKFPWLEFHLQLGVVRTVEGLAHAFGLDVVRNGTLLAATDQSYLYDVTRGCSGLRSLVALTALAVLMAYLYVRPVWARTVFAFLALPAAFAGNVVRIAAIVFAGELRGQAAGQWVHDHSAFVAYLVVLLLLGGVLIAVRRYWPGLLSTLPASPVPANGMARPTPSPPRLVAAVVVLAAAAGAAALAARLDALPMRFATGVALSADGRNPAELPLFVGSKWVGQPAPVTEAELAVLPPDTGYSRRTYLATADPRRQVFVSLVLSGQDRTSIHRPEYCLEGQGWTIRSQFSHRFRLRDQGELPVTVVRIEREQIGPGGTRRKVPALLSYWFVSSDGVVPDYASMLWRNSWVRLTRFRADRWAYAVAQTLVLEEEAAALAQMEEVLNGTWPAVATVRTDPM